MTKSLGEILAIRGPQGWLTWSLRQTNWAAAGISLAIQGAVLAMLIAMGAIMSEPEAKHQNLTVTSISTSPQQQPSVPAPSRPQQENKPAVEPRVDTVMPPAKIAISQAAPIAAAAPAPELSVPVQAATAPATANPAQPVGESGPIRVANLGANLSCPSPTYPPKANFERQEGLVVIQVVLSSEGRITESSVRRSSGFRLLDDAALAAVRRCRGMPTVRNGRAVDVTGDVNVPFRLRKS